MKNEHMKDRISILFEDITYNSSYEFLEEGKNDKELEEIATKWGLKVPSKDLAIFKSRYAFVDKENKNGCTLPRDEVKKALKTLVGKAIDKDHLRQSTIGFWFGSELEKDEIISYGAMWKGNFPEDFTDIKKRMTEGHVKVSFEAWGEKSPKDSGGYDLTDICFAGGALLFNTKPAFDKAEVLEFARVLTEEEKSQMFTNGSEDPRLDTSRLHMYDIESIKNALYEIEECPSCKSKFPSFNVMSIDFDASKVKAKHNLCGAEMTIDLEPDITITKKGKKIKQITAEKSTFDIEMFAGTDEELDAIISNDYEGSDFIDEDGIPITDAKKLTYKERQDISDDMFAVVVTVKNKVTGKPRKIRMFPIQDAPHVRNALARLPQATDTLKKLGVSPETVKKKILKRAKELKMTDLIKRHEKGGFYKSMDELLKKYNKSSVDELVPCLVAEIDMLKASLTKKDEELAGVVKAKDEIQKSFDETKVLADKATSDFKATKEVLDAKLAQERAAVIKARKDELKESGKDMSDEDILDNTKFELAKTKKELAELKAKNPTSASTGLEAGTENQETEVDKKRTKIHKMAFAETESE